MKIYTILLLGTAVLMMIASIPVKVIADAEVEIEVEPSPIRVVKVLTSREYAKTQVGEEWNDYNYIISHESSWNPNAQNPHSSAFGLAQFLNSTWKTVGCVKTKDPEIQIDCSIKYMKQRYGSIHKAKVFWVEHRWY